MTFIQADLTTEQIIGRAVTEASTQEQNIAKYQDMYNGKQGVLLTQYQIDRLGDDESLPDAFANLLVNIIQTYQDRLAIVPDGKGLKPFNEQSQDYATFCTELYISSDLDKEQDQLHRDILKDGLAGLMVEWVGEGETAQVIMTAKPIWNSSTMTGLRFDLVPGTNDSIQVASYHWAVPEYDELGTVSQTWTRVNVYAVVSGQVMKWRYKALSGGGGASDYTALTDEEIQNEIGQAMPNPEPLPISSIPIVRFINSETKSEIQDIYRPQKMINIGVGNIVQASGYHGTPTISAEDITQQVDEQGEQVAISWQPGEMVIGQGIQRIEGANMDMVWKGLYTKIIDMVSNIKGLPMWLLNPQDTSIPASGVALSIAEGSLVAQVEAKQKALGPQWQEAFSIAREWANVMSNAGIDENAEVLIDWIPASTQNVVADMAIKVSTAKAAGLSDRTIWSQMFGFTENQIEQAEQARLEDVDYWLKVSQVVSQFAAGLVSPQQVLTVLGVPDEQSATLAQIPSEAVEQ